MCSKLERAMTVRLAKENPSSKGHTVTLTHILTHKKSLTGFPLKVRLKDKSPPNSKYG